MPLWAQASGASSTSTLGASSAGAVNMNTPGALAS